MALPVDFSLTPFESTGSAIAGLPLILDFSDVPFESHGTASATRYPYIYVADSLNHRIQVFNYAGDPLFTFGSFGSGNGQFNTPYGVDFDGTYVRVTDSGNDRVQKFTPLGVYVSQFGSSGSALGEFNTPMGIHVDDNFVWVVDNGNNRFQVFAKSDDTAVFEWGEYNGLAFNGPTDCWGDASWFIVLDAGNNRNCPFVKNLNFTMIGSASISGFDASGTMVDISMNGSASISGFGVDGEMEEIPGMTGGAAISGLGTTGEMIAIDIMTGSASISAIGASGSMVSIEVMTGSASISALGASGDMLTIDIMSGSVSIAISASGEMIAVLGDEFTGIVMNLRNKAITTCTGLEFNSFAEVDGVVYCASATGIHAMTGVDDAGTDIDAVVRTGRIDLHDGQRTRLGDIWITGRVDGEAVLRVREDEGDVNDVTEYKVELDDTKIHDERIDVSRGHRSRFVELEFANKDGADFDLRGLAGRGRPTGRTR